MLTKNKKECFKRLLIRELEDLLGKDGNSIRSIIETSDQSPDFTDQASLESDMDLNIHMKERDSRLLVKVKEALERLEDGTYGICEECGKEISELRLKARPVTTMCITCKRKQEEKEKLRGP